MAMRVKLDEDLSPLVADPLREAGYEVATVAGQGWSGLSDADLWSHICRQNEFFITADKGFGDIRKYAPATHPGILLLRPDRESIVSFRSLVSKVLASHTLERLVGQTTVASPRGIRIRLARRSAPER